MTFDPVVFLSFRHMYITTHM